MKFQNRHWRLTPTQVRRVTRATCGHQARATCGHQARAMYRHRPGPRTDTGEGHVWTQARAMCGHQAIPGCVKARPGLMAFPSMWLGPATSTHRSQSSHSLWIPVKGKGCYFPSSRTIRRRSQLISTVTLPWSAGALDVELLREGRGQGPSTSAAGVTSWAPEGHPQVCSIKGMHKTHSHTQTCQGWLTAA